MTAAIVTDDGASAVRGKREDESARGQSATYRSTKRRKSRRRRRRAQQLDIHQIEEILGHPIGPNVQIELVDSSQAPLVEAAGSWGSGSSSTAPEISTIQTYAPAAWGDSWDAYGKSGKGSKSSKPSYGKSYKGKGSKSWDDDCHGSMPPVVVIPSPTRSPSASTLPTESTDRRPVISTALPSETPSDHPSVMPSGIANIVESVPPSASPSMYPSTVPSMHPSTVTSIPSDLPSNYQSYESLQPSLSNQPYYPSGSPSVTSLPSEAMREPTEVPIGACVICKMYMCFCS